MQTTGPSVMQSMYLSYHALMPQSLNLSSLVCASNQAHTNFIKIKSYVIFFMLIHNACLCQVADIEKIREEWLKKNDDKALSLISFVENSTSSHDILAVSLYYKGCIQFSRGLYKEAKISFLKIIELSDDLLAGYSHKLVKYIPALQLLHNASSYMYDIEFELSAFSQALFYQRQADYKYPSSMKSLFAHGVGLEKLYSSTRYAACYSALGIMDSVLVALIPIIIKDTGYSYEALLELKKYFNDQELRGIFHRSILTAVAENESIGIQWRYEDTVINLDSHSSENSTTFNEYQKKVEWVKSFF
jgi:tetratricopeptide (TPR) repeat protein